MMQFTRSSFIAIVVGVGLLGAGFGAWATGRAAELVRHRAPVVSYAEAPPILPVQMPLTTGTFAKVAEAIKPAVININKIGRASCRERV